MLEEHTEVYIEYIAKRCACHNGKTDGRLRDRSGRRPACLARSLDSDIEPLESLLKSGSNTSQMGIDFACVAKERQHEISFRKN
jgi:hypothetical protein